MVDEVNESDVDSIANNVIIQMLASMGCTLTGAFGYSCPSESNNQLMHNNAISAESQRLTDMGICNAEVNKWVQSHISLNAATKATSSEINQMKAVCSPAGAAVAAVVGTPNIEFVGTPTKSVDTVIAGNKATITVKFKNSGDGVAKDVSATAYIDGVPVGTSAGFTIGKGSSATVPIQIIAPSVTKCEEKRVVIKTSV